MYCTFPDLSLSLPTESYTAKKTIMAYQSTEQQEGTMSLTIPISWGELFDKITILIIKNNRISDPGKLKNIRHELNLLTAIRDADITWSETLEILVGSLQQVNEELWDIEDSIRICEKNKRFGSRFIELARAVYITNDRRAKLKSDINNLLGSEVVEEKSYQAY